MLTDKWKKKASVSTRFRRDYQYLNETIEIIVGIFVEEEIERRLFELKNYKGIQVEKKHTTKSPGYIVAHSPIWSGVKIAEEIREIIACQTTRIEVRKVEGNKFTIL